MNTHVLTKVVSTAEFHLAFRNGALMRCLLWIKGTMEGLVCVQVLTLVIGMDTADVALQMLSANEALSTSRYGALVLSLVIKVRTSSIRCWKNGTDLRNGTIRCAMLGSRYWAATACLCKVWHRNGEWGGCTASRTH